MAKATYLRAPVKSLRGSRESLTGRRRERSVCEHAYPAAGAIADHRLPFAFRNLVNYCHCNAGRVPANTDRLSCEFRVSAQCRPAGLTPRRAVSGQ